MVMQADWLLVRCMVATVRDQSRSYSGTIEVEDDDPTSATADVTIDAASIDLQGRISRGEFGPKWNALLESGGAVVADQVRLEIDAEVVPARERAATR